MLSEQSSYSRLNIAVGAILLVTLLFVLLTQRDTLRHNLALKDIDRTWNRVSLTGLTINNNLQDGIPDGWQARNWGGGQGIVQLVENPGAHAGTKVLSIQKTNTEGVTAVSQILPLEPETIQVSFRLFAKGQQGAAQIRFYLAGQGAGQPEAGGWKNIPPSQDWQRVLVQSAVPPGAERVEVLVRSNGLTYFDDAIVWLAKQGDEANNSAANPDFEEDGLDQDPITWWQEHAVVPPFKPITGVDFSSEIPFLNIMDMLNGRYEAISQRNLQNGNNCHGGPEVTSWLLNMAPEVEAQGGLAAREKLYQLAITLAPNCPQAHGQLGHLYEENRAFWAATVQYRKAAELSGNTPIAGFYFYQEGLTHVRHTGNLDQAIYALENAERLQTWVTGVVFQGAAAYNLGLAFRDAGRFNEAAAAFQRVIDCDSCLNYKRPAESALRNLENK